MLLVLCIVSLVLYRNWRYEQELDSLLWKIDYKELQVHESDKDSSEKKQTRVRIPLFDFINILFFPFVLFNSVHYPKLNSIALLVVDRPRIP